MDPGPITNCGVNARCDLCLKTLQFLLPEKLVHCTALHTICDNCNQLLTCPNPHVEEVPLPPPPPVPLAPSAGVQPPGSPGQDRARSRLLKASAAPAEAAMRHPGRSHGRLRATTSSLVGVPLQPGMALLGTRAPMMGLQTQPANAPTFLPCGLSGPALGPPLGMHMGAHSSPGVAVAPPYAIGGLGEGAITQGGVDHLADGRGPVPSVPLAQGVPRMHVHPMMVTAGCALPVDPTALSMRLALHPHLLGPGPGVIRVMPSRRSAHAGEPRGGNTAAAAAGSLAVGAIHLPGVQTPASVLPAQPHICASCPALMDSAVAQARGGCWREGNAEGPAAAEPAPPLPGPFYGR